MDIDTMEYMLMKKVWSYILYANIKEKSEIYEKNISRTPKWFQDFYGKNKFLFLEAVVNEWCTLSILCQMVYPTFQATIGCYKSTQICCYD